jgi:hypothetical protein
MTGQPEVLSVEVKIGDEWVDITKGVECRRDADRWVLRLPYVAVCNEVRVLSRPEGAK